MFGKSFLFLIAATLSFGAYQWYIHYTHPIAFRGQDIKVLDGNTVVLVNKKIKLQGIEAPGLEQKCELIIDNKTEYFPCGSIASTRLSKLIGHNNMLECTNEGFDEAGTQLSQCFVMDSNINLAMVKMGFATSSNDLLFAFWEALAKIRKLGLWHSKFEDPVEWKKKNFREELKKQEEYNSIQKRGKIVVTS
jgi:endonuclease YncB( thermonuclease family)